MTKPKREVKNLREQMDVTLKIATAKDGRDSNAYHDRRTREFTCTRMEASKILDRMENIMEEPLLDLNSPKEQHWNVEKMVKEQMHIIEKTNDEA